jgi:NAD(P)-dependent dehydrogenase (short-subunit alcohol dehydrogenase family)
MPPIPSPFTFRDRAILITGANRGLGAALCETILQYSPQIIYAGYRKNPGAIADDRVRWIPLDILQKDSIAGVSRNIPGLDVMINNAGDLIPTAVDAAQELDNLKYMMDLHLYGPLRTIDALLPLLKKSAQPIIVNMISMAAFASVGGCEAYCTSKAALHTATQGLRIKHPDIQCVGVYPGPTATDMTTGSSVPLADPRVSAANIIAAIEAGVTAIFPDAAAKTVEALIGQPVATLEARFSGLLAE